MASQKPWIFNLVAMTTFGLLFFSTGLQSFLFPYIVDSTHALLLRNGTDYDLAACILRLRDMICVHFAILHV
jgi:hypothetical protein